MSKLAKKGIYIANNLICEMQFFNNTIVYWVSASYCTSKRRFFKLFPYTICNNKLYYSISNLSSAFNFFNTYKNLEQKMKYHDTNMTYSKLKQSIVTSTVGFKRFIRVWGIGYSFTASTTTLFIKVRNSNLLKMKIPLLRSFIINKKATLIQGKSADLVKLNTFFAKVRSVHLPDVYKGKGIHYQNEIVIHKEGKKKKKT